MRFFGKKRSVVAITIIEVAIAEVGAAATFYVLVPFSPIKQDAGWDWLSQ